MKEMKKTKENWEGLKMKEKIKRLFELKASVEEVEHIAFLEKENKHLIELKDEAIKLHHKSKEDVRYIKSEIRIARTLKELKKKLDIR